MIYLDSRYADGTIFRAYNPTKTSWELTVFRNFPIKVSNVYFYEWVQGDRIDIVASRLFGDPDMWHQIMDFNPEYSSPFDIEPGTLLRIPRVS
jgi:hypothetical protein